MELKDSCNSENISLLNVCACGLFTQIFKLHYKPPGTSVVV